MMELQCAMNLALDDVIASLTGDLSAGPLLASAEDASICLRLTLFARKPTHIFLDEEKTRRLHLPRL